VTVKQAVIAPSALSLIYPQAGIEEYPLRAVHRGSLANEAEADVRGSLAGGASKVQLDFTEGRLSVKLDPSKQLLQQFIELNNRVLERTSDALFVSWERAREAARAEAGRPVLFIIDAREREGVAGDPARPFGLGSNSVSLPKPRQSTAKTANPRRGVPKAEPLDFQGFRASAPISPRGSVRSPVQIRVPRFTRKAEPHHMSDQVVRSDVRMGCQWADRLRPRSRTT
jgi:hypothetical protein